MFVEMGDVGWQLATHLNHEAASVPNIRVAHHGPSKFIRDFQWSRLDVFRDSPRREPWGSLVCPTPLLFPCVACGDARKKEG